MTLITRYPNILAVNPTVDYTDNARTRNRMCHRRWERLLNRGDAEARLQFAELERRIRKAHADAEATGYGCYVDPAEPRMLREIRKVTYPESFKGLSATITFKL